MDERAVAFWLVPAEPARSEFAEWIETLRVELDAPGFLPHITLFVQNQPSALRWGSLEEVLARAAEGVQPFEVPVRGIGHGEQLFKTLYLEAVLSPPIRTLHDRLRDAFVQASEYVLQPHLSLLYKELPADARAALAQRIQPPTSFACDRIAATTHGPGGWLNIPSWTEICSHSLGC